MSRVCELTGKRVMVGNNVSLAHNKTKKRFLPNLNEISLMSDAFGKAFKLKVSASALRSVDHRGELDAFLMKAKDETALPKARKIKMVMFIGSWRLLHESEIKGSQGLPAPRLARTPRSARRPAIRTP